ncbi:MULTISPECIES: NADPH-dependent FMN reductase [Lactococcus]|uniref:NADPH-dependent FMN reductase n=1 Tax=Lactococcus TaxID=1357 RepID=UPI00203EAF24|nr:MULTISPECIES: NADPH-dependent FMN reductase [Lactococcus]
MKFIAIVGTNASFSYNRKLLWYMKKHFVDEAEIEIIEIAGLPLFTEDSLDLPKQILEIAEAIEDSDGLIISTPEYNHGITAALKSLLEWLSWSAVQPLVNTPVMIVGTSLGKQGTVFAQENLRQILSSPGLEAFVLPANQFLLSHATESFDTSGNLIDRQTISWLEHCFRNFCLYAKSLKPLRKLMETDADTGASEHE